MDITVEKAKRFKGEIEIPADKSITHRAFLFSALTKGKCKICNYSKGQDCLTTLKIVEQIGCRIEYLSNSELIIDAKRALIKPNKPLYCGNSGTTTRLIAGILSSQKFDTELYGDESLTKRPMKRIIEPLELMGAKFIHNDFKLPIKIMGTRLKGIDYVSKLASAQVKSCILLAGINANGVTSFTEPYKSRNHTELMFQYMGADINIEGNKVSVKPSTLKPNEISICGDISSAAFFITAAMIIPNAQILLKDVGINETRTGILDVYKAMNANIEVINERVVSNERVADIEVRYSNLKSTVIEGEIIPRLIDELPIIAVAATQAEGDTIIRNAQDLRNKETDRISAIKSELNKIGANIEETDDGLIIHGKTTLNGGCKCECYHDHRIAMSEYIAGLIAKNPILIKEFEWVDISFPEFLSLMRKLI